MTCRFQEVLEVFGFSSSFWGNLEKGLVCLILRFSGLVDSWCFHLWASAPWILWKCTDVGGTFEFSTCAFDDGSPRCSTTPFMAPHPMQIYAKAPGWHRVDTELALTPQRDKTKIFGFDIYCFFNHFLKHVFIDLIDLTSPATEVMRGIDKNIFPGSCAGCFLSFSLDLLNAS